MAADAPPQDGWATVRLTEARQVAALIGHDPDDWPDAAIGVADHFHALRRTGQRSRAVEYLAHALPRLEVVAWAARVLEDESRGAALKPAARHALDVALRWVGEPNDVHRRAARQAAEEVNRVAPERYLGLAIFYSGGSISDADNGPIMPPEHAAARNALTAIGQAAYRGGDPAAAFDRALDLGEAVATRGMAALRQ